MTITPHYLLFSEANCSPSGQSWRFVLQNVETSRRMVVSDDEFAACGERLELLAVVRGLEALDGPARVTLVTRSRYVSRGIRCGLTEWRANDWQWERFGRIVPVKDRDLWQRVDRALLFHNVDCQAWQFEEAQFEEAATEAPLIQSAPTARRLARRSLSRKRRVTVGLGGLRAALVGKAATWGESLRTLGNPVRQLATGAA